MSRAFFLHWRPIMHDDRAMIRGRNARKRALHRSGVSISLSRLSDRTITTLGNATPPRFAWRAPRRAAGCRFAAAGPNNVRQGFAWGPQALLLDWRELTYATCCPLVRFSHNQLFSRSASLTISAASKMLRATRAMRCQASKTAFRSRCARPVGTLRV